MAFDKEAHLIKVQGGRMYLPVAWRLVWFREEHPDWGVITEPLEINHEKQFAVFRATIFNAEGKVMAMGTKKEDVKGFGDWIEKSETGAVGRALAMCGYGTQFEPEMDAQPREERPAVREERPPVTETDLPDTRTTRDGTPQAERTPAQERTPAAQMVPGLTKDQKSITEQLKAMDKPARNEWALWAKDTFGITYVSELTPGDAAKMLKALTGAATP